MNVYKSLCVIGTVLCLLAIFIGVQLAAFNTTHKAQAAVTPPVQASCSLPWHQPGEEVLRRFTAHNGAWAEVVDYNEGWVVRIHDPQHGPDIQENTVEGPLWSDVAAEVEARVVVDEIGGN